MRIIMIKINVTIQIPGNVSVPKDGQVVKSQVKHRRHVIGQRNPHCVLAAPMPSTQRISYNAQIWLP